MQVLKFRQIEIGCYYCCHPDHRDWTNHHKAYWDIDESCEITCFTLTVSKGWIIDNRGWGLHLIDNDANYLGWSADRTRRLFVARFEDGNANNKWHGYPADHQTKQNDRLPDSLKELWIRENVLPARKVRKLAKGEPCKL